MNVFPNGIPIGQHLKVKLQTTACLGRHLLILTSQVIHSEVSAKAIAPLSFNGLVLTFWAISLFGDMILWHKRYLRRIELMNGLSPRPRGSLQKVRNEVLFLVLTHPHKGFEFHPFLTCISYLTYWSIAVEITVKEGANSFQALVS